MQLACIVNSVTIPAFYDTLGIEGCRFILEQTQLTTLACAEESLKHFLTLKQEGKTENLKNFVIFGNISEENKQKVSEAGFEWHSYQSVVDAGKEASDIQL